MKELSIEEKAKRYDEAIEKAKDYYHLGDDKYKMAIDAKAVMEYIFPELKESQDERIRKDIVTYLKSAIANKGYRDKIIESWIAWLEKKYSQIPANSAKICEDEQKPIKEHNVCDFCEEKHWCVSHCPTKLIDEQKPTDFSDLRTWKYIVDAVWTEKEGIGQYLDSPFTEEVAKKLQKIFGKIEQKPAETEKGVKGNNREIPNSEQKPADKVDQYSLPVSDNSSLPTFDESIYHPCTEEVHEKKSSWSEEDEKQARQIERIVHDDGCTQKLQKQIADWFKSLKDRIQPKQKRGECLNERDVPSKELIYNIWSLGNAWYSITKGKCATEHGSQIDYIQKHWSEGDYYDKFVFQNTWKPSDEQMCALDDVISSRDIKYDVLSELLKDLKKLKE